MEIVFQSVVMGALCTIAITLIVFCVLFLVYFNKFRKEMRNK